MPLAISSSRKTSENQVSQLDIIASRLSLRAIAGECYRISLLNEARLLCTIIGELSS